MRFLAQGWGVLTIEGHDYESIESALNLANKSKQPFLIIAKTKIGKGSASLEGSHKTHGAPLGEEDIANSKKLAGFKSEEKLFIPEDVLIRFRSAIEKGDMLEREWNHLQKELPFAEQNAIFDKLLNPNLDEVQYPQFNLGDNVATRDSNGKILNSIAKALPNFIGGSADLSPSNKTELKGFGDFPNGKNIHFGIREHTMGAICNAISLYGLFIPFNATFFVFSDYLKPAARIASLMKTQNFFIWTHDSIGVGEDGATHQPIEHLTQFRALPNFYTFRPADANENIACWKTALNIQAPAGFVCSRQKLPVVSENPDVSKGAYLLKEVENAERTLIASGSEVLLALEVAEKSNNIINVVSVPCFDLLIEQSQEFINSIIKQNTKKIAIEASRGLEWYQFADEVICIDSFGASGKAEILFKEFGFSVENILSSDVTIKFF